MYAGRRRREIAVLIAACLAARAKVAA